MNIETLRDYCMKKKGVTEGFPFDNETLVFKVMNKMFALTGLNNDPLTVNLKCDPERAIQLREEHDEIQPGYHMNKTMWNTVDCSLPQKLVFELIDHSYDEVVKGLTKKDKTALAEM